MADYRASVKEVAAIEEMYKEYGDFFAKLGNTIEGKVKAALVVKHPDTLPEAHRIETKYSGTVRQPIYRDAVRLAAYNDVREYNLKVEISEFVNKRATVSV